MSEPASFLYLLTPVLQYVLPFLAFFVGTFCSTHLAREHQHSSKEIWFMSFPTGLLVVGSAMMTSAIPIQDSQGFTYSFASSAHQAFVFYGLMMFSGTISHRLFGKFQNQAEQKLAAAAEHGTCDLTNSNPP